MNTSSSATASTQTTSSKVAASFTPEDVQAHEHDVGADRGVFRIKRWKLNVQIRTDRQSDGRRGEDKLNQCRQPRNQSAFLAKGAAAVGKGTTSVRNRGGQLGETEDETGIHRGDHEGRHQKTECACHAPAVTPAEVFTRNHQPDRNAPQVQRAQRGFELCVHALPPERFWKARGRVFAVGVPVL